MRLLLLSVAGLGLTGCAVSFPDYPLGSGGSSSTSTSISSTGTTTSSSSTTSSVTSTGTWSMMGTIDGLEIATQFDISDTPYLPMPTDFTDTANLPVAYQYDDSQKKYVSYHANGDAFGNFYVAGVPTGPYLLDFGSVAYWLENRNQLNFDTYRTNSGNDLTMAPQVHLTASGMVSWASAEVLGFVDPESGANALYDPAAAQVLTPAWSSGATSIDATGDWLSFSGSKGQCAMSDNAALYTFGPWGGNAYSIVRDFARVTFATTDVSAPPFNLAASFISFNRSSESHEVAVTTGAFESAITTGTNPRADHLSTVIDHRAQPLTLNHWLPSQKVSLATLELPAPSPASDVVYKYGNPFTSLPQTGPTVPWPIYVTVGETFDLHFNSGSAGVPPARLVHDTGVAANLLLTDALVLDTAHPLTPLDTPPASPTVDGGSFFTNDAEPTLGSLTPVIAWAKSQTPHQLYKLEILSFKLVGGTPTAYVVKTVFTGGDQTSMRVPLGYLQGKTDYIFRLTALSDSGIEYQKTPNALALPSVTASAVSDRFATP